MANPTRRHRGTCSTCEHCSRKPPRLASTSSQECLLDPKVNRHHLLLATRASVCQRRPREGHSQSSFRLLSAPGQKDKCTPISKPAEAAESSGGDESAEPSTPPSTESIPTTLADLGVDTKRFVVAPEVIIQFEDQILRHWTNRIMDDYLQREILAEYNHRGTALIRAMEVIHDPVRPVA